MWFDEDDDRGDWCMYSRATPYEMELEAENRHRTADTRKYPEWAAREDAHVIRELTQGELEAEFARLWDEAAARTIEIPEGEIPQVRYTHTWRGLGIREGLELRSEVVSSDPDVADAFCAESESAPVVSDAEMIKMLSDECDKLVAQYREEAHKHLSVGYLVDRRIGNWTKADKPVAYLPPSSRPDAAFRNLAVAARNLVVGRVKEMARGVIAEVGKAVKAAKAAD